MEILKEICKKTGLFFDKTQILQIYNKNVTFKLYLIFVIEKLELI